MNNDRMMGRRPKCRPGRMPMGWMPTAAARFRAECRLQAWAGIKPNWTSYASRIQDSRQNIPAEFRPSN